MLSLTTMVGGLFAVDARADDTFTVDVIRVNNGQNYTHRDCAGDADVASQVVVAYATGNDQDHYPVGTAMTVVATSDEPSSMSFTSSVQLAPWSVNANGKVPSGSAQTFPATLHIPSTTPDGEYHFTVTMSGGAVSDFDRFLVKVDCVPDTVPSSGTADTTAPTIVSSAFNGTSGLNGWFTSGGAVSVVCSDDGGATTFAGTADPSTLSDDGVHTVSISCTDAAGNATTDTVTISIDGSAPSVACAAADTSWHDDNQSSTCTASDVGPSGIDGAATAELSTSVAAGTETANASTGSHTFCDAAGNCTTGGPISGWKVDRKAPTGITFALPQTLTLGSTTAATCTATDLGSGLGSCTVSGFSTSSIGARTATASAVDNVGNQDTAQQAYSVVYGVCGGGTRHGVMSPFKSNAISIKRGRDVPVKIQLCDAAGNVVVAGIGATIQGSTVISQNAHPSPYFRVSDDKLIYNLSTDALPLGTYQYKALLNDGVEVPFSITVTK
ncbi:MAG TPA: hypothetical protein VFU93_10565 [Acidimicrobiales bacterium]|nr:hypothetical protein [Acidimicrobiales bacterium]